MIPLASAVMVASGAACLGGAVISRRWIAISAATLMLFAMIDLAAFSLVPALVWAIALMLSGILLALQMRLDTPQATAVEAQSPTRSPLRVAASAASAASGTMIVAALAYPVMGWLVLGHAGFAVETSGHAGHGGASLLLLPVLLAWLLSAVLLCCFARALARRQHLMAVEMGAMAAMLIAMLVMPH